jgi:hypothetical protein
LDYRDDFKLVGLYYTELESIPNQYVYVANELAEIILEREYPKLIDIFREFPGYSYKYLVLHRFMKNMIIQYKEGNPDLYWIIDSLLFKDINQISDKLLDDIIITISIENRELHEYLDIISEIIKLRFPSVRNPNLDELIKIIKSSIYEVLVLSEAVTVPDFIYRCIIIGDL